MGLSQPTYPIIGDDGSKILLCCDCNEEFVFTKDAQKFFEEKGYINDPKRCKSCYTTLKKLQRDSNNDVQTQL